LPFTYARFRNQKLRRISMVKTSKVAIADGLFVCGEFKSIRMPSW